MTTGQAFFAAMTLIALVATVRSFWTKNIQEIRAYLVTLGGFLTVYVSLFAWGLWTCWEEGVSVLVVFLSSIVPAMPGWFGFGMSALALATFRQRQSP